MGRTLRSRGHNYEAQLPRFSIFKEDLVAEQLEKTEVHLSKPIYVVLCILDLSKILLYEFYYDYMKRKFDGDDCKLLYTDTDSLLYEIRCSDIYDIMKRDIRRFDTSDYPANNQFNMPLVNNKIVGLMKDECNGRVMTEFIGLRSKMYYVRIDERTKKLQGVMTGVVETTIIFEDFLQYLWVKLIQYREQRVIRSRLHKVYTEKQTKIALSPHDDKRYLPPDTTDTLPLGALQDPLHQSRWNPSHPGTYDWIVNQSAHFSHHSHTLGRGYIGILETN